MRSNLKQLNMNILTIGLLALAALPACTQAPGLSGEDSQSSLSVYNSNSSGVLNLNSTGTQLAFGKLMTFTASGGDLPYVYTVSGPGSIDPDNGTFLAGQTEGLATVQALDIHGRSATAYVYVSASGGGPTNSSSSVATYRAGVTQLTVSATSGYGGCAAGTLPAGSVANAFGAPPVAYGDRQLCLAKSNLVATSQVYADISLTPPGYHGANVYCPAGYTQVGSVPDCGGGMCSGEQLICAKIATPATASYYVTNFLVSAQGQHYASGAGCPAGYITAGSAIDCGGGTCSGYQTFCKTY